MGRMHRYLHIVCMSVLRLFQTTSNVKFFAERSACVRPIGSRETARDRDRREAGRCPPVRLIVLFFCLPDVTMLRNVTNLFTDP